MNARPDLDEFCTCGQRFGLHRGVSPHNCPRPGLGYTANEFARAAPAAVVAPFRIGGIYRRNDRMLVKVAPMTTADHVSLWAQRLPGRQIGEMRTLEGGYAMGYVCLDNGWYVKADDASHLQNLIPGELDAHGNPIGTQPVIVVAKPEASLATSTHPADLAMVSRDGPAKAKPAAITPPPVVSTVKPSPFAAFTSPDMCGSGHQVNPLHASAAERSNG